MQIINEGLGDDLRAGDAIDLYDTVERPYEEWRQYLYDIVALMIDTEEDAPFNPPTSG